MMGVGEDDRRWTIRVCEPCGELVTWCRCEWLPRRPEPPSVDVDVVPASVVVGLRGEVERLRARERELEDALRLIAETDWVDAVLDPDRALRVARAVLESSSDAPVDVVQPDGYATHTTCAACGGTKFEAIMDPEAGACRSCSGSGRVPTNHDPEGGDDE